MKRATELAILVIGRLFLTALTTKASSPDAWKKHYQEVTDSAMKSFVSSVLSMINQQL